VDKLVSSPPRCQRPTVMQLAGRQSAVVRPKRGAAIRSTQDGNHTGCRKICSAFAPHRSVASGLRLSPPRPLALRQAPTRRPGPACRGSPFHALRAHRLIARGRCLPRIQHCSPRASGKELCPLRTSRGSGDAVVRNRRGAPPRIDVQLLPGMDKGGEGRGGD
jgi:hypothetical protein